MRRGPASLASSPLLVGTITVLITATAFFLAYQANNGLPFVPTFRVTATLPDAQELRPGDQVLVAGRLVGQIADTRATYEHGHPVALLDLKLDRDLAGEVRSDATVAVRPASLLGAKYLDLNPGSRGRPLPDGSVLPESQALHTVELDQVIKSLDEPTRPDLQRALVGLADGVASRGPDLNAAIERLRPLVADVSPTLADLARPSTHLGGLVRNLAAVTAELAPASGELTALVRDAQVTMGALNLAGPRLGVALRRAPRTISVTTSSLRTLRPVLAQAARMTGRIEPSARLLPVTARRLTGVLRVGVPVLRQVAPLGPQLVGTLADLRALATRAPLAETLRRLGTALPRLRSTLDFLAPYQTVCNYLSVGLRNFASAASEGNAGGNWLRVEPVLPPGEVLQSARPSSRLHYDPYPNGAAPGQPRECEAGNSPYLPGRTVGHAPGIQPAATEPTSPASVARETGPP